MKTTSEITQEHKKFLSSMNEIPMNIYLEKANKKWYSEEELKGLIKQFKENIELSASPDNNEDNSYYNAICDFEIALFGDEDDKRSMD